MVPRDPTRQNICCARTHPQTSDRDAMTADTLGMKHDQPTEYFILSDLKKSRGLITEAPSGSQFCQTGLEPWRKCGVLGSSGTSGLVDGVRPPSTGSSAPPPQ